MRIATWNVNSLKARLDKVALVARPGAPDVLLMQETKLADADAPVRRVPRRRATSWRTTARAAGTASPSPAAAAIADVVTNFGQPLQPARTEDAGDDEPLAEARMIAALCGGVRVVSVYAPNGRVVGSTFYEAKLAWFDRLARWLAEAADRRPTPLVLGGDFNVAPTDADVWDPRACHGGTHVSPPRARGRSRGCARWGLVDAYRRHHPEPGRYTWWDYRAGNFHKNFGMRIDHLLVTRPAGRAHRVGRDRPRGAQGQADPVGPRAAGHRRRRARPSLRRRLGLRRGPHRRAPDARRRPAWHSRSSRPSSRCSRSSPTRCRRATAGCSSRSGTASARSSSATATRSTSRAAT